jgi:hypothetical protein
MLELLLVTPILLLFLAYGMEIGRMITKLAREIGRFAASVPSLETGTFNTTGSAPTAGSATGLLYSRAEFLFGFYDSSRSISSGAYTLSTSNNGNVVDITISTEYHYLFGALLSMTGADRSTLEVHIVVPRIA